MKENISKELKQTDLNLLITLQALLRHKSVKKAAEELFLSDSAVSRALSRLRATFNDELFIRTHKGLEPTDKLKSLEDKLSNILNDLENLLKTEPFELSRCEESFAISTPALIGCDLIPELMVEAQSHAPKISILEVQPQSNPFPSLIKGDIDLAFHNTPTYNSNFHCIHLGTAYTALYVRNGHPLLRLKRVDFSDLYEYPIIGNIVDTGKNTTYETPIKKYCDKFKSSKKSSLRSVQLHTLIRTTELTDSIFLSSRNLESIFSDRTELTKLNLRGFTEDSIDFYLILLKSNAQSESYQWIIDIIKKKYTDTFSGLNPQEST